MKVLGRNPDTITAAVQGFGNVGSYTAKTLNDAGVLIVAISDVTGAYYSSGGIDIHRAFDAVRKHPKKLLEGFETFGNCEKIDDIL